MNKSSDLRTGRHCVFKLHVHLVFVTKYRKKIFTNEILRDLKAIFQDVARDFETDIVEMNGENNYIELRKVTTTTKNLSFAIICLPRCYVNKVKYTIMTLLYNVHKERLHIV